MKNVAQYCVVAMPRCSQDSKGNVSREARQLAAQLHTHIVFTVLDSTIIASIPTPNPSKTHVTTTPTTTMAPLVDYLTKTPTLASRAIVTAAAGSTIAITRRNLSVNSTQKVTLGIIAVYVVVIALLWNIPYVRWVLWPFKVSFFLSALRNHLDTCADILTIDACHCFP